MKKIILYTLLAILAFATGSCSNDEPEEARSAHAIAVVQTSGNISQMPRLSAYVIERTAYYSAQWAVVQLPDKDAVLEFDYFCKHIKEATEEYARENNLTILPDSYAVFAFYNGDRLELKRTRVDFEATEQN